MAICKFYLRGECRFGDGCRFEHPANVDRNAVSQRNSNPFHSNNNANNSNRYATLDSRSQQNTTGRFTEDRNNSFSSQSNKSDLPYSITEKGILIDLQDERPQWILSAYGPGLRAPGQLLGGPLREQSFEEVRLQFYETAAQGNVQMAIQQQESMYRDAEQQIQNIVLDVSGAIRYILDFENTHPNRLDICNGEPQPAVAQASSNPFGNPVSLGTATTPFGQSAPPSQPYTSAFGQSTALGQRPNPFGAPSVQHVESAFAQPAVLGQTQNPFGTSMAATRSSAFGQPSGLGQTSDSFVTGQQMSTQQRNGGTFGQPSFETTKPNIFATSQPYQPSNQFGQPNSISQTSATSGNTSTPVASGIFGQASSLNDKPNPFVTNIGSSLGSIQPSPFGQPAQAATTNPFGQLQSANPNPFVTMPQNSTVMAKNPFLSDSYGQSFATRNSSDSASQRRDIAESNTPIDGLSTTQQGSSEQRQTKHLPSTQPAQPNSSGSHAALSSYATKDNSDRLTMFKGKRVQYRDGVPGIANRDGSWEKIWNPDGAPLHNKDTELNDEREVYLTPGLRELYDAARNTGMFEGGMIPLVPPLREWCTWDF